MGFIAEVFEAGISFLNSRHLLSTSCIIKSRES
jgi:hypothetical protein